MAKRSFPFASTLFPVPAAVLTFSTAGVVVPFLTARWLGMTWNRTPVVSAALSAVDGVLDGLVPGDLFVVHLPTEEFLLKPWVRRLLAAGPPEGTPDIPLSELPGDLSGLVESAVRIECRYRSLRTLFDQRIIRGEVAAVDRDGHRYTDADAVDLCRRHPFTTPSRFSAASEVDRAG